MLYIVYFIEILYKVYIDILLCINQLIEQEYKHVLHSYEENIIYSRLYVRTFLSMWSNTEIYDRYLSNLE